MGSVLSFNLPARKAFFFKNLKKKKKKYLCFHVVFGQTPVPQS